MGHPPRLIIDEHIYFLTICTYKRIRYFSNKYYCSILIESWNYYRKKLNIKFYAWVIMPEHLHLLVKPTKGSDVSLFLNNFKSFVAHEVNKALKRKGLVWKEGTYDHVIRNKEDFYKHYDYIHINPVKHGYVTKPQDYKFSSYYQALKRKYYEIGWGYIHGPTQRDGILPE